MLALLVCTKRFSDLANQLSAHMYYVPPPNIFPAPS
jgi:hypothetical protein